MLIYQVYPRSFKDSSNDGIGDLRGIAEKLPYIRKLGMEAVWISPFVRSPQKDFGYDVSDYCAIDPLFGNLSDFKDLVKKAHALGLKIIMDQVFCHCSDQHAWFKESRKNQKNRRADWFIWADPKPDGGPPNNWLSYFGGPAWTWDKRRKQYYFHQFLSSQPTFNLRHPLVRRALLDVARFWIKLGVDGFRLDAVHTGFSDPLLRNNPLRPKNMPVAPDVPSNIPQARQIRKYSEGHIDTLKFLEELRRFANRTDTYLLGEVSGEDPFKRAALYTQGKRLHEAYNFGLLKGRPDAASFHATVAKGEKEKRDGNFCYALSNHDVTRVFSRWGKGSAKVALLFGLTLPGSYCLYQGEELGLPESKVSRKQMKDPFGIAFYPRFKGRDGCRTPMPWLAGEKNGGFTRTKKSWLPFDKKHQALAVDVQEKDRNSTLHFARRIIKWRKGSQALQDNRHFKALVTRGDIIGFERGQGKDKLLCLFNTGQKPARFTLPKGKWRVEQIVGARLKGRVLSLPAVSGAVVKKT
jgi:alpha-glucosidase